MNLCIVAIAFSLILLLTIHHIFYVILVMLNGRFVTVDCHVFCRNNALLKFEQKSC